MYFFNSEGANDKVSVIAAITIAPTLAYLSARSRPASTKTQLTATTQPLKARTKKTNRKPVRGDPATRPFCPTCPTSSPSMAACHKPGKHSGLSIMPRGQAKVISGCRCCCPWDAESAVFPGAVRSWVAPGTAGQPTPACVPRRTVPPRLGISARHAPRGTEPVAVEGRARPRSPPRGPWLPRRRRPTARPLRRGRDDVQRRALCRRRMFLTLERLMPYWIASAWMVVPSKELSDMVRMASA